MNKAMNKTIFIIDDDPVFRFIVEMMMSKIDNSLTFITCENGKVGLEKLKDYLKTSSECIILLDLNMPILDGWDFLDEIQSSQLNTSKNISIHILSSSTDKGDIEKTKQYSWVRKFYSKPLSDVHIAEILNFNTTNLQ